MFNLNPRGADEKFQKANSVDQNEAAHYELPHSDLHCLQVQLFSFDTFRVKQLFHKIWLISYPRSSRNTPAEGIVGLGRASSCSAMFF